MKLGSSPLDIFSTPVDKLLCSKALRMKHPDESVEEAIKYDLFFLHTARYNYSSEWVKTSPSQQQGVWKREWWDKFDDVAGYRNTKSEILDGFKLVDEYLVQWMRREFLPSPDDWLFAEDDMVEAERAKRGINRFAEYYLSEAEREKLADIFEALCGIWGILTCYDYVGTDDPATDDVYANWKRIP